MHPETWPTWLQYLVGIPAAFVALAVYNWLPGRGFPLLALFSSLYTKRERALSGILVGLVIALIGTAVVKIVLSK